MLIIQRGCWIQDLAIRLHTMLQEPCILPGQKDPNRKCLSGRNSDFQNMWRTTSRLFHMSKSDFLLNQLERKVLNKRVRKLTCGNVSHQQYRRSAKIYNKVLINQKRIKGSSRQVRRLTKWDQSSVTNTKPLWKEGYRRRKIELSVWVWILGL